MVMSAITFVMACSSATVEAGAELETSPPWSGWGVSCHPFDRALALVQRTDAAEADADLRVRVEPEHAGDHGSIAAAPAAGVGAVGEVATYSSSLHGPRLRVFDGVDAAPDPDAVATGVGQRELVHAPRLVLDRAHREPGCGQPKMPSVDVVDLHVAAGVVGGSRSFTAAEALHG